MSHCLAFPRKGLRLRHSWWSRGNAQWLVSASRVTVLRLVAFVLAVCLLSTVGTVARADGAAFARVRAAADEAQARIRLLDREGCRAAVARVADEALTAWTPAAAAWIAARNVCLDPAVYAPDAQLAFVHAVFEPMLALLRQAPDATPELVTLTMDVHHNHWAALDNIGEGAASDRLEQAAVQPWVQRLASHSDDALAMAALRQWASRYYGNRARQPALRRWIDTLGARLGEGHAVRLQLLNAASFANRMLSRPQAALDDAQLFSRLAGQYHRADHRTRMTAAFELALALEANGRWAESLDQLLKVRRYLQAQQPVPHASLMRVHYNLAALAYEMGDDAAAVAYADESLRHSHQLADARDQSEALTAQYTRGLARLRRGEAAAAVELKALVDSLPEATLATGEVAYAVGRHAQHTGDTALLAWATDRLTRYAEHHFDPVHGARPLVPLLAAARAPHDSDERRRGIEQALALSLVGRSGSIEAQAWFELADHRASHQPDEAIWLYKRGANVLQQLRGGLPADDPGGQRAWLADHEGPLRQLVALLIDRGRLAEAQQAIRVLRDEELHEYTRRSRGPGRRGAAAALSMAPAERRLDGALQPAIDTLRAVVPAADARADAESSFQRRTRRSDDELQRAVDHAAQRLHRLVDEVPARGTDAAAPTQAMPAAGRLAPDTRRLLYFVRSSSVDIVVQGRGGWQRVAVPVPQAELNRQVHALRVALSNPQLDPQAAARQLHRWLVQPVQHLLTGAQRLQLVPDGVLRYVPFAALHDGQRFVAQRWVLVHESGASWAPAPVPATPTAAASPWVLALGRTVGDADHAALPGVADELAGIGAGAGDREGGGGRVRRGLDAAFNAGALAEGLARRPAVVHLASHFVLDAASEEGAYLLLGDGERLPLSRLRALPWQGVHLAVLSACDTGVPGPGADSGRQATGLAAALQGAGAANVLATLWPVNDGATSRWMSNFYRPWQGRRALVLPRAEWMTLTQRRWLQQHAGTELAHPHYWAGFLWLGGR